MHAGDVCRVVTVHRWLLTTDMREIDSTVQILPVIIGPQIIHGCVEVITSGDQDPELGIKQCITQFVELVMIVVVVIVACLIIVSILLVVVVLLIKRLFHEVDAAFVVLFQRLSWYNKFGLALQNCLRLLLMHC